MPGHNVLSSCLTTFVACDAGTIHGYPIAIRPSALVDVESRLVAWGGGGAGRGWSVGMAEG